MDESYLEWLTSLPGWGAEKAKRVADRFPTYEHLRAASRDEIGAIEGLSVEDADALHEAVHGTSGRDASGHLFLCPECGSFAGLGAKTCPFCGVEFQESAESDLGEKLDAFLQVETPAHICQTCGASMVQGESTCSVCGRAYTPE